MTRNQAKKYIESAGFELKPRTCQVESCGAPVLVDYKATNGELTITGSLNKIAKTIKAL